jgi:hypothetical protein
MEEIKEMEKGRTKTKERNDGRYLKDVLVPGLGMRGYVLALNRRSARDNNLSTLFYFLRQEKYSVVCGSSEHEFLHKRTPHTKS